MSDLPERDGDGYLLNMNEWTPEIGRAMAEADGVELDDAKWSQIEARVSTTKMRTLYLRFVSSQNTSRWIRKKSSKCG